MKKKRGATFSKKYIKPKSEAPNRNPITASIFFKASNMFVKKATSFMCL